MKKTLIAAALLAGFAGAAQAETSVTLYGIVDLGVGYQKIKGGPGDFDGSKFGLVSGNQNGSRWGLRGTEDLGGGTRAVFTLESGFEANNGRSAQGSRLFGRQSTVGLANDAWGQLDFGRQTNIGSKYFGSIDPFGAGFGQANIGAGFSALNTVRYDNMIQYQTPSYSGFQVGAGYSFNTGSGATSPDSFRTNENQRAITAGIRYANGPLNVAASYDQLNQVSSLDDEKVRSWNVGGSYDFETSSWLWLTAKPATAFSVAKACRPSARAIRSVSPQLSAVRTVRRKAASAPTRGWSALRLRSVAQASCSVRGSVLTRVAMIR